MGLFCGYGRGISAGRAHSAPQTPSPPSARPARDNRQVPSTPDSATLIAAARDRLAAADAPRERLGEWVEGRRLLGIGRAPRIVPTGEAWHVGVLLIADAAVFATGEVLRAREHAIRGYTSEAQRARDARAGAAFRGGFAEGETVHLGWTRLDLDALSARDSDALSAADPDTLRLANSAAGPLLVVAGIPHIRWSTSATRPLADYLDDQLSLPRPRTAP